MNKKTIITALLALVSLTACEALLNWDGIQAVPDGYQELFSYGDTLERRYAYDGPMEVDSLFMESSHERLKLLQLWFPKELRTTDRRWPVIVMVNGSGTEASRYKAVFRHLASWGFIVAGNQDGGSSSGESTAVTLDSVLRQDITPGAVLYGKVDTAAIGLSGHSQGGVVAFNAAMKYDNARYYKVLCAQSPVNRKTAAIIYNGGYTVDGLKIPSLVMAGSGTSDDLLNCPLEEISDIFSRIDAPVVIGRMPDIKHEHVLARGNAYMTAWMLYWLCGDTEAKKCFVGKKAEILSNNSWQDVKRKGF